MRPAINLSALRYECPTVSRSAPTPPWNLPVGILFLEQARTSQAHVATWKSIHPATILRVVCFPAATHPIPTHTSSTHGHIFSHKHKRVKLGLVPENQYGKHGGPVWTPAWFLSACVVCLQDYCPPWLSVFGCLYLSRVWTKMVREDMLTRSSCSSVYNTYKKSKPAKPTVNKYRTRWLRAYRQYTFYTTDVNIAIQTPIQTNGICGTDVQTIQH